MRVWQPGVAILKMKYVWKKTNEWSESNSPQQDEDGRRGSKAQKQTLLSELRIAQPWSEKKERVRIHFKIAEILMDSH